MKNKDLQIISKFEALGKVYYGRYRNKWARKFNHNSFSLKNLRSALNDVSVVISNTITNGDILPFIRKNYDGPIISYIHELEMAAAAFTTISDIKNLIKYSDYYFVPSDSVKLFLVDKLKIHSDKIDLLSYYIPRNKRDGTNLISRGKNFVVGSAGTIDWRKGADLFIQVALKFFKKNPLAEIKFAWQGAYKGIELDRLNYDISRSGLTGKIELLMRSENMGAFYDSIDVFLLLSREDPYPLVVLEAANSSVPTICFRSVGGAPEFVQDSAGICVDYLDIDSIVEGISFYYENDLKRKEAGVVAKNRLTDNHQNEHLIIRQLKGILSKLDHEF